MPTTINRPIGETHFRLLRLLETRSELSQRELARELGTSVGKINYCLNALIDKGWVKVRNFRDSQNTLAYAFDLAWPGQSRTWPPICPDPYGVRQGCLLTWVRLVYTLV